MMYSKDILINKLSQIWSVFFPDEKITAKSDFFACGGTSISALELLSKFYNETGIKLELEYIFEHSVLEELAQFISDAQENKANESGLKL